MKMFKRRSTFFISALASSIFAGCVPQVTPTVTPTPTSVIALERIGRTASQGFGQSAAEVVDYDKTQKRIFTVNALSGKVDVFTASDITNPTLFSSIDLKQLLVDIGQVTLTSEVGAANSVAVYGNYAAIAVEANPKTNNGWVVFLNTSDLSYVNSVDVGALPDMVKFTPDGTKVLVANEGEPNIGYTIDPEGTVSVIRVATFTVNTVTFNDFNTGGPRNAELPLTDMIVDGYNASVSKSFEPEYIAVSEDNTKAYVGLQENNAIAVINLSDNTIDKIMGLGFKDHSIVGNELDGGNQDLVTDGTDIKNWPVMGMYMPDSIATMTYNAKTYLITANEGDAREDWLNGLNDAVNCPLSGYYHNSSKCKDELELRNIANVPGMSLGVALTGLNTNATLGRLRFSYFTTKVKNGNSHVSVNTIYAYGGRSFSIYDTTTGAQVFDSGSDFEDKTFAKFGTNFNNEHDANVAQGRSDNKGPEPEGLAVAKINGYTYAFISLERMGGIMVYNISNPLAPVFVEYINDRNLSIVPGALTDAGDLGPESIHFVSAANSPNGKPLLMVANEVSGTTSIYEVKNTY